MSIFRWILLVLTMAPVSVCGLWAGLISMDITDQVNAKLPADQQFPFFFSNHRYFELRRRYRERFPDGRLLDKHDRLTIIAAASMGLTVVSQLTIEFLWR